MSVLVSIDCITYNHEKYISDAIESFLKQITNFEFEILIHDDASTDDTKNIIREYEKKYPHLIKPIYQKENQYSKGIKRISYEFNFPRAKGKYIAVCEGDDYWVDPYKLQKQIDYMENHPDCGMCFHAAEINKVGEGKVSEIRPYNKSCITPIKDIILGGRDFIATNSIVYRKQIMNDAPYFYLNASVGDYPLRVMTSTHKYAYYMNEIMSTYRIGVKGSWTTNMLTNVNIKKIINVRERNIELLNELNKYTKYKYNKHFKKQKSIIKFKIAILKYLPHFYLKMVKSKNIME